jgi:hypothetical protein
LLCLYKIIISYMREIVLYFLFLPRVICGIWIEVFDFMTCGVSDR